MTIPTQLWLDVLRWVSGRISMSAWFLNRAEGRGGQARRRKRSTVRVSGMVHVQRPSGARLDSMELEGDARAASLGCESRSAWSLSTGSSSVLRADGVAARRAQCTVRPPQIGEGESRRRAASASGAVVIEAAEKANSGSCGSIHASGSRGAYPVTDSPNPQITPGGSNTGLGSYWPQ